MPTIVKRGGGHVDGASLRAVGMPVSVESARAGRQIHGAETLPVRERGAQRARLFWGRAGSSGPMRRAWWRRDASRAPQRASSYDLAMLLAIRRPRGHWRHCVTTACRTWPSASRHTGFSRHRAAAYKRPHLAAGGPSPSGSTAGSGGALAGGAKAAFDTRVASCGVWTFPRRAPSSGGGR